MQPTVYDKFRSLADEISRREYVISRGGERDFIRVSQVGIPCMNGKPLPYEELQNVDVIRYDGRRRVAQREGSDIRIRVRREPILIPFFILEDVHDRTHLLHSAETGIYPLVQSMMNMLNREALARIYEEI